MPIKIVPRAVVSDAFIIALRALSKERLVTIKQEYDTYSESYRKHFITKEKNCLERLTRLAAESAFVDFEVTRLRALPYTRFDYLVHYNPVARKRAAYLYGITQEIVLVHEGSSKYNLGPYGVFLPLDALLRGQYDGIQLVPQWDPMTRGRHPHHTASQPVSSFTGEYVTPQHYLDYRPSTCWGGFGAIVMSCLHDGDIVELFRTVGVYLGRYDPHSPLLGGGIDSVAHKKRVSV